jgi:hypothetical protein
MTVAGRLELLAFDARFTGAPPTLLESRGCRTGRPGRELPQPSEGTRSARSGQPPRGDRPNRVDHQHCGRGRASRGGDIGSLPAKKRAAGSALLRGAAAVALGFLAQVVSIDRSTTDRLVKPSVEIEVHLGREVLGEITLRV